MIRIRRKHTAGLGIHYQITLDEHAYDALTAAIEVAFDDPDSVPAEYADAADEWWRAIGNRNHLEGAST